jgi:SCY1-like protein 1
LVLGILALVATQQFYTVKDIAERILPALVILCVDLDESVRVNTFRALKGLLEKLEKLSDDPTLKEDMGLY